MKWYLKRHMKPKTRSSGFSYLHLHHAFTGMAIACAGFVTIFYLSIPAFVHVIAIAFGLWLFLDDVYQHIKQKQQILGQIPCYFDYPATYPENFYYGYRNYYDIVTFWHWWPEQWFGKKFKKY